MSLQLELRMQQQLMMIEERLAEARYHAAEAALGDTENIPVQGNVRPYKCNVCEKSFEHSGKLHRHMRIHTGERPHECNVCGKTFIQSGQLVIHMRVHTGDRPYACNHCEKAFTCSKQLKVHMRTHTKEKPYKCEICGKSFGYNHVLKLHQVAHFGEKMYKCTLCDTTFNKKKHLEMHIRQHDSDPSSAAPQLLPSIRSLASAPPPAAHCPAPREPRFLLPSIDSLCPEVYTSDQPQDLSTKHRRQSAIRRNPLYPVTPALVRSLLAQDLAEFGPPTPLASPRLSPDIYGDCLLPVSAASPLTPPPSVSPPATPLSSAASSVSSMSESSLPLRKRRLAYSECSASDSESCRPSPATSPADSDRSSVICFAMT